MRATSGKSLFTETLYVAQIIRYVIVYGIVGFGEHRLFAGAGVKVKRVEINLNMYSC